ncbi:hypothetical protein GALMADRAFT_136329 [Galerina marginata CBS 339.88]|uniref:Uncharacterized protein n=1 Tax=Galerina marginata (strain CBS 339.88) TaxID=685588 RepID=A0A067TDL5_GALM3|nr:hypothetical protein GALMADRAFT_136329 [Galerina marginata CBS 339.88]
MAVIVRKEGSQEIVFENAKNNQIQAPSRAGGSGKPSPRPASPPPRPCLRAYLPTCTHRPPPSSNSTHILMFVPNFNNRQQWARITDARGRKPAPLVPANELGEIRQGIEEAMDTGQNENTIVVQQRESWRF